MLPDHEFLGVVAAERIRSWYAMEGLGLLVPLENAAVRREPDDGPSRRLDERSKQALASLERFRLREQLLILDLERLLRAAEGV